MNQIAYLNKCIGLLEKINDLQAELKNEQENLLSKRRLFPLKDNSINRLRILEIQHDILKTKIEFNTEIRLIQLLN